VRLNFKLLICFFVLMAFLCTEIPSSQIALAGTKEQIKLGRGKAQLCTRCHGRKGMVIAIGQIKWDGTIEEFVIKQLSDFRDGSRSNTIMSGIAKTLSDDDIAEIAAWYHHISTKQ